MLLFLFAINDVIKKSILHTLHALQVAMCKFHTVFLSQDGAAYSCGNGRGGRLGTGNEELLIDPQLINFSGSQIIDIAAAVDHTIFVSEEGHVS